MKIFTTLLLCSLFMADMLAQPIPSYNQTITFGNYTPLDDPDSSFSLMGGGGGGFGDSRIHTRYDSQDNLVSAGIYISSVDFDPNDGITGNTAIGNDGFVQKLDGNGTLEWVKWFGGNSSFGINDVALDNSDNIYVWAYFIGTVDVDPGDGVTNLTSTGNFNNCLLIKLSSAGDFVWASHFTNTNNSLPNKLFIDPVSGDVLASGIFMGTTDFDPSANTINETSGGSWDGFMVRLNADGQYVIHHRLGVTGIDSIVQTLLDENGNMYMIGSFAGVVDFDFGAGVYTQTSGLGLANAFVAKYNADGGIEWARMLGGSYTSGFSISLDDELNVYYISNMNSGTIDVDPGAGEILYTNSLSGLVVVKLSPDGTYLNHAGLQGSSQTFTAMQKYVLGGLYIQGYFNGTVDFDPGADVENLTTAGNQEFIWMLDEQLQYFSAFTRPNTWPTSIAMKGAQFITSGVFTGTTDFDPSGDTDNQTAGPLYSFYVTEFDFCQSPTFGSITTTSCGDYVAPSGQILTTSGIYTDTIPNFLGCDSIITINLNHLDPVVPMIEIITATDSICQGDMVELSAVVTNGGLNPTFTWFINENQYNVGATLSTNFLSNHDEVYAILVSSEVCLSAPSDTSNVIEFIVGNPGGTAEIFLNAYPSVNLCSSDTVVISSNVFNPGENPVYSWMINNQVVDAGTELVIPNPVDGDVITCTLQSSDVCLISGSDTSDPIELNVIQSMVPQVTIEGPGQICPGEEVVLYAFLEDEGSNPSVNWYLNESDTPIATGNTFLTDGLNNGDALICVLVNNDLCAEPVFDISNEYIADVYLGGEPQVEISYNDVYVCGGSEVIFTASYENEGSQPSFQWYVNGNAVNGATDDEYVTNMLNNGDVVECSMTSSLACVNNQTVIYSTGAVEVHPVVIDDFSFDLCPGDVIEFGGITYDEPGFYQDTLTTFFGCDSIVNVNIFGVNSPDLDITVDGNTLISQQSEGQFQWVDCTNDFEPIPGANASTFSPSVTGSYAVEITINNCVFMSECMNITIIGVDELLQNELLIYPNPVDDYFVINSARTMSEITIEDMAGQLIYHEKGQFANSKLIAFDQFESGVYLISIATKDGIRQQSVIVKK